jgi:4-amino-4-deoxy-L-arabinose transferase-like glycosyltransferase
MSAKLLLWLPVLLIAVVLDVLLMRILSRRWQKHTQPAHSRGRPVFIKGHYSPVLSWLATIILFVIKIIEKLPVIEIDPHPLRFLPGSNQSNSATGSQNKTAKVIYLICLVALAGIPPLLVIQDRWWWDARMSDFFLPYTCQINFLCNSVYPAYFILAFSCLLALLLVILFIKEKNRLLLSSNIDKAAPREAISTVNSTQAKVGRWLLWIGWAGFLGIAASSIIIKRLPGIDLVLIIAVLVMGYYLWEIPIPSLASLSSHCRGWIVAFGLMQIALILFFDDLYSTHYFNWIFVFLLLLASLNLIRYFRNFPTILWVFSIAVVLYLFNLNAWWLSHIGDEFEFYYWARRIAQSQNFWEITANVFSSKGGFGTHPYLSSVLQAISMVLFGANGFGWKFSSLYLSAISILFFYLFFKTFVSRRIALTAALLLAFSHYIMSFGKIGYNNLQALLALSLVLWAGGRAVKTRRLFSFVILGLSLGFCFYLFPAALYAIPVPILLLMFYYPPTSRRSLKRWVLMIVIALVLISPLFLQPDYWQEKIPGTFLNRVELTSSSQTLLEHIRSNFTYAFFSYLYTPEESHFIAVSYVDPLTAVFVAIGFLYLLRFFRRERFIAFWMLSFIVMLFLAGASHDKTFPPSTRMFLILPWLTLFASFGIYWLVEQIKQLGASRRMIRTTLGMIFLMVLGLSLYQAYPLARDRMTGFQSLETLFFRMLLRAQVVDADKSITYVFITDPTWSSSGIQHLTDYYPIKEKVVDLVVEGPTLPEASIDLIKNPDTYIIIKPWMDEPLKTNLEIQINASGKESCDIHATNGDFRFKLWHAPGLVELCQ